MLFDILTTSASTSAGSISPAAAIFPFIFARNLILRDAVSIDIPHFFATLPISSDCPLSKISVETSESIDASNDKISVNTSL